MTELQLPTRSRPLTQNALVKSLIVQRQVMWALILHDIKTRFFGNGLGYVLTILWPMAHIAIILALYIFGKRPVPYGDNALLYASTGVLPYIAWSYIARFTMMGMMQNRTLLSYPIIKPLDVVFGRIVLECISTFLITVLLVCLNFFYNSNSMPPHNMKDAACGVLSAVFLGIGFGVLNAMIVRVFFFWFIGFVGILIICWFSCGMAFDPESLPTQLQYYLSWNPLLHCVEWVRSGFYPDFPAHILDKTYVLMFAAVTLFLGLLFSVILDPYFK